MFTKGLTLEYGVGIRAGCDVSGNSKQYRGNRTRLADGTVLVLPLYPQRSFTFKDQLRENSRLGCRADASASISKNLDTDNRSTISSGRPSLGICTSMQ
ncbi:hypothetical protein FHT85_005473 [Rhizobium sp. BK312]|uniref:hypothetical protein n=1 Tax=Rhizobium sp. BK312 TaxID=2587080 RepID=UPI0013AEA435|nr:hypothetical protein [Rhizobium sp. BK312]MBB3428448.1 hypothetical protein [Rhizobium sp. BK312]